MKITYFYSMAILLISIPACSVINPSPFPTTEAGYACPVTAPNGSQPPGEEADLDYFYGNGEIWTAFWPDGVIIIPPDRVEPDGSLSMKFPWWRGVSGQLEITGRRLDAEAPALEADIPDGYGETGFQATALVFASPGCWEVTGKVGDSSLTFVTLVVNE